MKLHDAQLTLEVLLREKFEELGWDRVDDRVWLQCPVSKLKAVANSWSKYVQLEVPFNIWPVLVRAT